MTRRILASIGALAIAIAVPGSAQVPAVKAKSTTLPRTPDGHPDLQGFWTNATITPLERPSQWAGKVTLADSEAAVFEKQQSDDLKQEDGASDGPLLRAAGSAGVGGYNALFIDRGNEMARIDGVKRTALVIDPADGKIPATTAEAKQRMAAAFRSFNNYDNVKARPLSERCIIGFGSTAGPPMMPDYFYNNNYQIVQTADTVMILVEMIHDVRTVRMNGKHAPANIQKWLGDSVGHWEGDTLVIDTTNFRADNAFHGGSEKLHVIERLQRIDAGTILYRATMEDPSTWAKPWTIEYPFLATPGPIYEYACHEGNYAMEDILGGARRMESQATKK
jgi:hypothetical protein